MEVKSRFHYLKWNFKKRTDKKEVSNDEVNEFPR